MAEGDDLKKRMKHLGHEMKADLNRPAGMGEGPGEKEMVEVKAHSRGKGEGHQGHPAKRRQPLSMRFLD